MITIDMKMPTDCNSCLIRKIMGCKIANESGWLNNRRDERCLLKEVVRCKDCKYLRDTKNVYNGEPFGTCTNCNTSLTGYALRSFKWFCADGERKSADEILMEEMDADPLG